MDPKTFLSLPSLMPLVGLSLLFFLCISCQPSSQISKLDGRTFSPRELDDKVVTLMQEAKVTGLALAIFNEGKPIYQQAYGYADRSTQDSLKLDHVFYAASFSKAVFGYVVSELVHRGIMELDTPLQSYLPMPIPEIPTAKAWRSLAPLTGDARYEDITARMCLSHTTGLPNWRWIEDDQQLKFRFDPGTRYRYSGEGIMLLQWVVEHLTQKPYEDLAKEMVFEPLAMVHSGYLWEEEWEEHFCYGHDQAEQKIPKKKEKEDAAAAGSMQTTLLDYSRFVAHLFELYRQSSPVTQQMFTPSVRIRSIAQFGPLSDRDSSANDDIELSYGLGWGLLQSPYGVGAFKEGHDHGFQHYSIVFPEAGVGIIIMTNSDQGESIFKELLEYAIGDTFTPWRWENYVPY